MNKEKEVSPKELIIHVRNGKSLEYGGDGKEEKWIY